MLPVIFKDCNPLEFASDRRQDSQLRDAEAATLAFEAGAEASRLAAAPQRLATSVPLIVFAAPQAMHVIFNEQPKRARSAAFRTCLVDIALC